MTTENQIDRRAYGQLEQQVKQLASDVHALKQTVESMKDMMQQARGGWTVIMYLAGASATVGAFIAWALSHVTFKI